MVVVGINIFDDVVVLCSVGLMIILELDLSPVAGLTASQVTSEAACVLVTSRLEGADPGADILWPPLSQVSWAAGRPGSGRRQRRVTVSPGCWAALSSDVNCGTPGGAEIAMIKRSYFIKIPPKICICLKKGLSKHKMDNYLEITYRGYLCDEFGKGPLRYQK